MTSARTVLSGLAVGVGLGAFVACMSAHAPQTRTLKTEERVALVTEMENLSSDIRNYRKEIGLAPNPISPLNSIEIRKTPDGRHVCPDGHVAPPVCGDVCNTSDYICDNSKRICEIAKQLGEDDAFAKNKCTSASASCTESKQKCCDCTATSATPDLGGNPIP